MGSRFRGSDTRTKWPFPFTGDVAVSYAAVLIRPSARIASCTIGRAFTDTFAGIAPASVPGFVAAQLIGAAAGIIALTLLYPAVSTAAVTLPAGLPKSSGFAGSTRIGMASWAGPR